MPERIATWLAGADAAVLAWARAAPITHYRINPDRAPLKELLTGRTRNLRHLPEEAPFAGRHPFCDVAGATHHVSLAGDMLGWDCRTR